jgi:GLPGLI family protein
MKTMRFIPILLLACIAVNGQVPGEAKTSGTVRYDEKMTLEIKLEGESAAYSEMLPKERTEQKILYFSPEASLYESATDLAKNEMVEQEGANVVVQVYQDNNKVYRDLKENRRYEQRDFMTRQFLIESDQGATDWKLTGNQQTIAGFPCQEAVREEEGRKIRAWFTPSIPVSTGPGNQGNLPGMILAVDVNDGQRTVTATSVDFTPVDTKKLVRPKEGKKVTAEQYKKIVDEKMKEMGAEGGGSGQQVMIRISR